MRRMIPGGLMLVGGAVGSCVVWWWSWLFFLFMGQAFGLLTDEMISTGLLVVGSLAGGAAGLLAAASAQFAAMLISPSRRHRVFLMVWAAWALFGAVLSAIGNHVLSTVEMAVLLSGGHLMVVVIHLRVAALRDT